MTTNSAELGFEEQGDVGVGVVVFVQIELPGEGGGIIFGVEEYAEHAFRTTGDEDMEGKGGI